MSPKIEKARQIRVSMALEAQTLPTLPEDDVCCNFFIFAVSRSIHPSFSSLLSFFVPPTLTGCLSSVEIFYLVLTVDNLKQPLLAPKLNQEYGDTVPSRPYNIGLQVENEVPASGTLRNQHISDGVKLGGEGMHVFHIM